MRKKFFLIGFFLFAFSSTKVFSILIDNFLQSDPDNLGLTTSTGLYSLCTNKKARIIRTLETNPDSAKFNIGNNILQYTGTSSSRVNYSPSEGYFDFSGYHIFRINFAEKAIADLARPNTNFGLGVSMIQGPSRSTTVDGASADFELNPGQYDDFTQISSIQISFNTIRGSNWENLSDFTLTNIEVIPEPFSIITLGTGITTFIKKRRKYNY